MRGGPGKELKDVQSHQVENTPDVEVECLLTLPVLKVFERSAPATSRIGDEDVNAFLPVLDHFGLDILDELLNLIGMTYIRRDGDRLS